MRQSLFWNDITSTIFQGDILIYIILIESIVLQLLERQSISIICQKTTEHDTLFICEKNNWCHFSMKQEKRLYPLSRSINGKLCKLVSSFLVAIILKSRSLVPQITKPIRLFMDHVISPNLSQATLLSTRITIHSTVYGTHTHLSK